MAEASYFVAEAPGGRVLGTWPAGEVRRRLAAGALPQACVCLPTDATGDISGRWRRPEDAFGPAGPAPAVAPRRRAGGGRRAGLWVAAGVLVAGSAVLVGQLDGRAGPPPPRPAPFTDLDAALAAHRFDPDWALYQPPPLPGPYRPSLTGLVQVVPRGSDRFVSLVARDAAGNLVEVDRITSEAGLDLMVVPLQTEFGLETYAILKRDRPVPERDAAELGGAPDRGGGK
jgi:hypothetical protein